MRKTNRVLVMGAGIAMCINARPFETENIYAVIDKPKSWHDLNNGKLSKKQRRK